GCSALAGGTLTLSGTIGQPAAGFCMDGSFTMIAGFWAGDETASILPWLTITSAGANVIVSWPSWANAYGLQTSSTLTTPIWAPVSTQPALVGDHYQVLLPATKSNQFFRLISQ